MNRRAKRAMLLASLLIVVAVTSGCEIDILPVVDCSGIDQPDMGGLICFGLNMLALSAGAIAIILAILVGLPR